MIRPSLSTLPQRLGWRPLVWGAVLAVIGVVLSAIPLFDLLGYDYAFAVGLVAAFATADIGHGVAVGARRTQPTALLPLTGKALMAALGVLVLPLAISLGNGLRVRNCSVASGLAFYGLLPVATAMVAAPAGMLCGLVFPRRGRLVALALPAASIAWSLVRLYRDPAIFALDPWGGYFPGPIYDEALEPTARLLWFRLANLVWVAAAVAIVRVRLATWSWRTAAPAGVLLLAATALFLMRGRLGFHIRHQDVRAALSRTTESAHFVLHTDPRSETAADLTLVHADLEFRYQQLRRLLGVEPRGRVIVYRFPGGAAKKDLVGAGTTLYAKPWTREIFLQTDRFPSSRLRHELAHVFAAAFGDRLFGVSLAWRFWGPLPVPRLASGLIEGLAEAADFGHSDARSTIHQDARAIVADGRAPPLAKVVGAGFTALAGARAYTLAGSFCHYLLHEHGAEKMRALYRSAGDFQAVYGQPLDELERRWREFLERQPLAETERARAAEQFRRPAIFHKVCARELAARVARARGRLGHAPQEAVALLESVCRDDPGEPTFRLDLADALVGAGESDRALAIADAVAQDEGVTRPLRARAAALAAAIHFHASRFEQAEKAVRRTATLATDDAEERTALAKLRALGDDETRGTLGRVLFGDGPARGTDPALVPFLVAEFTRLFPREALGPYLVARQLAWRDPRLALPWLDRACPRGALGAHEVALDPPFLRECRRLYGETAFLAGDLDRSQAAFERLREEAAIESEKRRAADWLERIAFSRSR